MSKAALIHLLADAKSANARHCIPAPGSTYTPSEYVSNASEYLRKYSDGGAVNPRRACMYSSRHRSLKWRSSAQKLFYSEMYITLQRKDTIAWQYDSFRPTRYPASCKPKHFEFDKNMLHDAAECVESVSAD